MFLVPDDLAAFADIDPARAGAMIEDAEAMAVLAAPCITDEGFRADPQRVAAVRSILRGAVLRWHEAGTGAVVQESTGPFSRTVDTKTARKGMFWPDEISQLRDLCAGFSGEDSGRQAYAVDTAPASGWGNHSPICALVFGAPYCSCGADLTVGRYPLYEGGVFW